MSTHQEITWHDVNSSFATVSGREDIDGAFPVVILVPNRTDDEAVALKMTPAVARKVARKLNLWAKRVEGK